MKESLPANGTISHYRILEKLGAGGMGEVYLAEDTKLGRKVAIKILPGDVIADERANRRMLKEAQAAATLDHPNICAVHEVGEEDGRTYIVMQYVEGETLANRLHRKPLDLGESLDIAVQTADALAEAHSRRIIHRDIKPQNIMITGRGQVKVLDFGLAKVVRGPDLEKDGAETQSLLTHPGMIIGTVPYMSPEQAKGEPLDARSDIFSFGAVLYEMVSGRQPFASENTAATISAVLTREPAPLARYSREAPTELERIVSKSLAKNKEQRYQTAKDLLIDLQRLKRDLEFDVELQRSRNRDSSASAYASVETVALATNPAGETAGDRAAARTTSPESHIGQVKRNKRIVAATLFVVIAGIVFGLYKLAVFDSYLAAKSKPAESKLRSMAVLPFSQLGAGESDGYLELGMADVLITRLSNLSQIVVRPTDTVLKYAAHGEDLAAGRELGVDLLLTGRMQRAGDRIRVTVQLVSVTDGRPVWAEQFDEKFTDLFTVEDSISQKVVKALTLKLTAEEQQRMAKRYTQNADAYQEYLKGRFYFLQYTPDGFTQAVTHLNRAIAMDPTYALAYAGLADANTTASEWLLPPREAMAKAKAAALKALSFDETLAEAHAALGHVKVHELDPAAEQELLRALELNPNAVTTLLWYGEFFMTHDPAKAIATLQRAQQLDPLSSTVTIFLSWAYLCGRQPEPALKEALKAIELDPNNPNAHATVGLVNEKQKNYPEALAEIEKANQLAPLPQGRSALGRIYALMGKRIEAQKIIAELMESSRKQYVSPYDVATIYAALGDKDQAFTWLDKAFEDRSEWLGLMTTDFRMDSLRSDPRFPDLMRRVGLEPKLR